MISFVPEFVKSLVKCKQWGLACAVSILCIGFTQAQTILVHGDSLSAGYGMNPEQTWVALLAEQLGQDYQVINSSISGETSQGGLNRLPALLAETQPDVLILELGANDGLRGYPIKTMRGNLERMIELAQEREIEVVLLGIRLPPNFGSRYTSPFYNTFAELAQEYKTGYLPFLLDGVAQFSELMQADGLHPNIQAQAIIRDNVLPVLEPLLNEQTIR